MAEQKTETYRAIRGVGLKDRTAKIDDTFSSTELPKAAIDKLIKEKAIELVK